MDKKSNALTAELSLCLPSIEQRLSVDWQNDNQVQLWLKRDDQIHSVISGNKWRKLSYALEKIYQSPPKMVISFGGGYSNHLHALAYCCAQISVPLLAIVRGDYSDNMTPMLTDIQGWGANIEFVSKAIYQQRTEQHFLGNLIRKHPGATIIPEGGSSEHSQQGVNDIIVELTQPYDWIIAPVASGGTLAGLSAACGKSATHRNTKILGVAALKGENYLESLVEGLCPSARNWQIEHGFHFGGYAKSNQQLDEFCADFQQSLDVPIEPVYSGKMLFAIRHMVENNEFAQGSKILALHTGGLQGARSA
ncbi:MAG: pyridoxal-phosphate dependent enzyme [Aliiglaciecola sp.]|uniref:1-aminocyclopropane-1-carboxylate deaminase/D-cysteine desulfhydrase n=1 Tax=Aliiglaciecola sp. M165 TaxID=2593649 RepID=UPI00117EA48B|nr:pyridoxal-phosphate dependent enzyme [Aliiglaciecola sp. M165]TRY31888.1 pyridoxal-phosphate dependent enzyme [Aliiglaciecola sp. M165]